MGSIMRVWVTIKRVLVDASNMPAEELPETSEALPAIERPFSAILQGRRCKPAASPLASLMFPHGGTRRAGAGCYCMTGPRPIRNWTRLRWKPSCGSSPRTCAMRFPKLERRSVWPKPRMRQRKPSDPMPMTTPNYGRLSDKAHLVLWIVPILAGCATTTSDVGQVKEVAPGIYWIGVGRGVGSSVLIGGGTEAVNAAVEQAGQYCHSKGQKLVILSGKDVTFRCGEKVSE
jgi:hypothetical protein